VFHYLKLTPHCHAVTLTSCNICILVIVASTVTAESTWDPVFHAQTSLHQGLVLDSQPPQTRDKLGVVPQEVWVVEIEIPHAVPLAAVVFSVHDGLLEAVEVELADKAREVGRLEGIGVVRGAVAGGQDLRLEETPINDDDLALFVPADGNICRVVHQTPELGWEVIGVDGLGEGTSPDTLDFACFFWEGGANKRGKVGEPGFEASSECQPNQHLFTFNNYSDVCLGLVISLC